MRPRSRSVALRSAADLLTASVLAASLPPVGFWAGLGEAGSRRARADTALILARAPGFACLPARCARAGHGRGRSAMAAPAAAGSLVVSAVSIAIAALVRAAAILILVHGHAFSKKPGRLGARAVTVVLYILSAKPSYGQPEVMPKDYLSSSGTSSGSQPKDSATALACAARSIERSSLPVFS